MIVFEHKLSDPMGLHARPAGQLVKITRSFDSEVTVSFDGKAVDAKRMIAVMGLGTKGGDIISVSVEGADEAEAAMQIKDYLISKV